MNKLKFILLLMACCVSALAGDSPVEKVAGAGIWTMTATNSTASNTVFQVFDRQTSDIAVTNNLGMVSWPGSVRSVLLRPNTGTTFTHTYSYGVVVSNTSQASMVFSSKSTP